MTPVYRMNLVKTRAAVKTGTTGTFAWGKLDTEIGKMRCLCIKMEHRVMLLPVRVGSSIILRNGSTIWRWDGNKVAPTLSPAINSRDITDRQVFIEKGYITSERI